MPVEQEPSATYSRTGGAGAFARGIEEAFDDRPAESQQFYVHSETGLDYVKQLLAEELRPDKRKVMHWKQVYHANHLLDCEVIAAACADDEWLPNLKMLAAWMKSQEKAATDSRPTAPTVARSNWMTR